MHQHERFTNMAKRRRRGCLQDGLSLNLNWLARNGFIEYGAITPEIQLTWSRSGALLATARVSADMAAGDTGWLRISTNSFDQRIRLASKSRNFGGRQWYFLCPATGRLASVVWKPPGASLFCSRHAWGGQVAYQTQFGTWIDRAHLGKAKIKVRLVGKLDTPDRTLP